MNNEEIVIKKSINEIIPNKYQPRKFFDELELKELSDSIKNYGIINPILVRKSGEKYEIIAGERRFRAAKMCGLTEVPVIIKEVTDTQSAELALIENLGRQDLTAVEAAKAYEEIIKLGKYTQSDLSKKIGKSQSSIANKLRLLTLPEEIQQSVIEKKISERHARSLLEIKDKEKQIEILNKIIAEKLTVKETEELIDLYNLNDEDIENAINSIMKSIKNKEEKESDKMNNGNFFPTYDNNMIQNNNMNTVPQAQSQPAQSQENIMPTFVPTQQPETTPATPPINPTLDTNNIIPSQPENNNFTPIQPEIPSFGPPQEINTPQNTFEVPVTGAPAMDTPLFNQNIELPNLNNTQQTEENSFPEMNQNIQTPTATMDAPLFNSPQQNSQVEEFNFTNVPGTTPITPAAPVAPTFDMPVNEPQPVLPPQQPNDKVKEIENLLTNNGITYKSYSNDTNHCIIIEL